MSSPNISFDNIPSSIRKPGQYFEFNTKLAVRTLPANAQKVLIVAPMLASGSLDPLVATSVFSGDEAAVYFGYGSIAHLMVVAAINTYSYLDLTVIGVSDASAGVAAAGTLTITGPASSQGVVSLWIGKTRVDVAVSAADTVTEIAAAMKTAIDNQPELPVTAAVSAGVLTLTAKNKGAAGNDIRLRAQTTASGTTTVVVGMASGATDPDIAPALANVVAAGHNIIVSPYCTQTTLTALRTHLDFVSGPMEQRGAVGVAGWPGTLAAGTTLASQINSGRITVGWHNGSVMLPAEIAAAYGARIASEEDPARPLNTLALALDVTDLASRPGRTEQENALHNGLTPFEVGSGETVQIVRAITTYTRNASGVDDVSLLDLTTIRTLDYVRKACRERIALRFPREKLSTRTPPLVRSELYDVLLKLEELEIIEEVDANKDALIVERDSQDVNRLNARIPSDVVNGLHVFAGRIDLLL
ncbi:MULTISPECIES: phage tail sheath C-terminal domain-containing protein [Klebsiella pneumoniae complex]|uniref:phage tail sheath C-terminal domain-containing protein n=1 Tax=Klebsiella pneumoniae complex TaxID=3390273 RepID=UPI000B4132AF|nr:MULTISPECIES: phage tail sheath C-terminal domain-containing protein [Klebsiella]EKZ5589307.1 phage tail sheath subtilisin-like domain-containing protein [Klebsiella pneumoniae]AZJ03485.1 phage tail protein [Klebsiella quasipneumoniae]AZJ26539.1 phage tail protein [Klebsiella quasipneumoniae subsp. similipneumoniae]EKZ6024912.1 phage tail sheath subtilisin-like domain-containing protein [Klebsiella pneumoniae]ELT0560332.1 phage tail sheath subtilisin-like domain-containing protein [Klebsiel